MTHAEAIGLDCTADELSARIVDEVISSLGVVCDAASPLGALIALLGTARNERHIAELRASASHGLVRGGAEHQATKVNAWVALNDDVPTVHVMNDSDAPIFDVRPTPALIGYGEDGEITAQVGHSPLGLVRQIDPHGGWAWRMDHCRGWGGVTCVKGRVHAHFVDASGRSWRLGHDRLVPEPDPWGPRPDF